VPGEAITTAAERVLMKMESFILIQIAQVIDYRLNLRAIQMRNRR
jgi:hypothetical protein